MSDENEFEELEDLNLDEIMAETENLIPDPGLGGYDEQQEVLVRDLMAQVADYAESGPKFDPEGRYLCETCQMRIVPDRCSHVSGEISMETGSCEKWLVGVQTWPINPRQWTQKEANYAERSEAKGFGCSRCEYGKPAAAADVDGRAIWCGWFGTRVQSLACCCQEDGDDLKLAPGE